ncbi:MAG: hypothetical protein JNL32_01025 [Candidatus Kapabacteria bacterium]|nr:hypothetical protein [Candidatus Kapabacteria bacterium]
MVKEIEILERFIADMGSAKTAAEALGVSAPTVSQYRKGVIPFGPAIRERLRQLGYSTDDTDKKIEELREHRLQIKKIVESDEEELRTLRTMSATIQALIDKKEKELSENKLTLLVADTLTVHPHFQKVAEQEEHTTINRPSSFT